MIIASEFTNDVHEFGARRVEDFVCAEDASAHGDGHALRWKHTKKQCDHIAHVRLKYLARADVVLTCYAPAIPTPESIAVIVGASTLVSSTRTDGVFHTKS